MDGTTRACKLRPALLGAALALAGGAPRAAEACSVCLSGRDDESQRAFLMGSIFLSLLPFALIGGIALFVRRRLRQAERRLAREAGPAAVS